MREEATVMNPLLQNKPRGNGNMLQQFQQFKKMLGTQDPQQLLNELMASGKFTQAQLEQAKQMAEQFKGFLK